MPSNYKRLGDYIQEVNIRNSDLSNIPLLGVSIKKVLMPSIANIIGTDMSTYKLIKKNQFAYGPVTSRNGDKISIALLEEFDNAMVSQAYTVFEVIDENELLPEYLMMWFRRPEFDRYARFISHGSAREIFSWTEMCETLLPIPSLEKQKQIVREYNTIQNRIIINNQLISKLEETAQAIYKQWYVDFEFPDDNGKAYKSNFGEMEWCDRYEKEIPKGWKTVVLGDYCSKITKGTTPQVMYTEKSEKAFVNYIKGESLKENHIFDLNKISYIDELTHKELNRSILAEYDICYSIAGTLDKFAIVDKTILPANTNQAIAIIRVDESKINRYFIIGLFLSNYQIEYYNFNIQQAVQANLSLETISSLPIILPEEKISNKLGFIIEKIFLNKLNIDIQNQKLEELKELMLAKMTRVEEIKEHRDHEKLFS
jgi:type I restriction enzyme S subunit